MKKFKLKKNRSLYLKVSKYFKNKRVKAGLTQYEAAKTLNFSAQYMSNWERGVCLPPLGSLTSICRLYGITNKQEVMGLYLNAWKGDLEKSLAIRHLEVVTLKSA